MNRKEREALVEAYLGKTVPIVIDRPMGYVHAKKDFSITYPINYGYIPGAIGGDGEELDVYLLGVDEPVKEYTGRIIGVVYRDNDVEDKLVAAPEGMSFDQAQIAQYVQFQEQFFQTRIDALCQKSCGAVVYRRNNDMIEYLCLLQKRSGLYSIPKGHSEAFETEQQTAMRELCEEAGIEVTLDPDFRTEIRYRLSDKKEKTVAIFLAAYNGEIKTGENEITGFRWLPLEKTKEVLPQWYAPVMDRTEMYLTGAGL